MKRLVLAGGGHSHLFVLEHLADHAPADRVAGRFGRDTEVILISPSRWQYYSGMLPGWIAGQYRSEHCRIDLQELCARAGVRFMQTAVTEIDADGGVLYPDEGQPLSYGLLSLDVGSATCAQSLLELDGRLITVKPLESLVRRWPEIKQQLQEMTDSPGTAANFLVAGGGAAGVELVMAVRNALSGNAVAVTLACGPAGLLPDHGHSVRRRVTQELARQGISVYQERAATGQGAVLVGNREMAVDFVLAATGACAPDWLHNSGLALDGNGFVQVNGFQQSISHANVFAAGDVCVRTDFNMARSGVNAVRAGPILARNLYSLLKEPTVRHGTVPLKRFTPRQRSLYLLSCGDRRAIASWGSLSAEGRWVWRLKDFIDRRFISRFTRLSSTAKSKTASQEKSTHE